MGGLQSDVVPGSRLQDGDEDIFVTTLGGLQHLAFINGGHGTFTEEATARGLGLAQSSPLPWGRPRRLGGMTPSLGDINGDGFIDVFLPE